MDALDVARVLADALEAAGVPHAIGGAIALGYWADPRGTHDVDLNLFLPVGQVGPALDALISAGLSVDREGALQSGAERGDARGHYRGMRVDLFFNSIPLHDSAASRIQRVPLMERQAWILSAEDLIVLKLLYYRGKDLVDVEKVVAMQRDALDRQYVHRWLVDLVGEADHRVAWWDRLCAHLK